MIDFRMITAPAGFVVAGLLAAFLAGPAPAQTPPDALVRAELRPGWQMADGRQMAALHITLQPGWKTYWRSPGEAGIPPAFDWAGSQNVAGVTLHWPRPKVFDLAGYRTLAYPGELVLPVEITPARTDQPVRIALSVDMGVCEDICVPITIAVTGDLSGGTEPDPLIQRALDLVPDTGTDRGLPAPRCTATPIRDGMRLTADIPLPGTQDGDFAVVELDGTSVWAAPVSTTTGAARMVQVTDLVPGDAKPFALNRRDVRITAFAGGDVVEFIGCKG